MRNYSDTSGGGALQIQYLGYNYLPSTLLLTIRMQCKVQYVHLQISRLGFERVEAQYGFPRDKDRYGADDADRLMVLRGAQNVLYDFHAAHALRLLAG